MRLCIVTMAVIAAFLLSGCGNKSHSTGLTPSAKPGHTIYRFPTRNVSGFRALITGDPTPDAEGVGYLSLPAAASPADRVPLMVILHGSGGTWGGRGARHAEFLRRHGIGALVIDTFLSRGLSRKDSYIRRLMEANVADQIANAFGALAALQDHPFIDGRNIGIMGYSMGGASAILCAYEQIARASSKNSARFALHVAFYAPCIIQPSQRKPTGAPVIAFWGMEDGATPKSRCEAFLDAFEADGVVVQTTWYAGAAHGWNGRNPPRYYNTIQNFAPCEFLIHENGQLTETKTQSTADTDQEMIKTAESCADVGYTIGRHDKTNELADRELINAINRHMRFF